MNLISTNSQQVRISRSFNRVMIIYMNSQIDNCLKKISRLIILVDEDSILIEGKN